MPPSPRDPWSEDCPICYERKKEYIALCQTCWKSYCDTCFARWEKTSPTCPHCRAELHGPYDPPGEEEEDDDYEFHAIVARKYPDWPEDILPLRTVFRWWQESTDIPHLIRLAESPHPDRHSLSKVRDEVIVLSIQGKEDWYTTRLEIIAYIHALKPQGSDVKAICHKEWAFVVDTIGRVMHDVRDSKMTAAQLWGRLMAQLCYGSQAYPWPKYGAEYAQTRSFDIDVVEVLDRVVLKALEATKSRSAECVSVGDQERNVLAGEDDPILKYFSIYWQAFEDVRARCRRSEGAVSEVEE